MSPLSTPRPRPDLIIFDCDGVLVDSEMIASRVLARVASLYGPTITEQDCRARFTGLSIARVADMLAADGYALPDDFTDVLRTEDKAAFEAELKPVAGVADVLGILPTKKAVASSGRMEKIIHSLTITGLIETFTPHIFSAEQVMHGKPAPDLFLLAAHTMNVAPQNCVVIEDAVAGVQAARAADMTVFGFAGASHAGPGYAEKLEDAGADLVFDDMAALPGLLGFNAS